MSVAPLDLIGGALSLDPGAFQALLASPAPARLAAVLVVVAGLSSALGQSVVLFAARVTPRRFVASLVLQAVIFAGVYLVWTASIDLVATTVYGAESALRPALAAVGLGYAPQLLAFFVLVPFLGSAINVGLSVWTFLSIAIATSVVFDLEIVPALVTSAGGWILMQLAQRTIGWPIGRATRFLRSAVAGKRLDDLDEIFQRGRDPEPSAEDR